MALKKNDPAKAANQKKSATKKEEQPKKKTLPAPNTLEKFEANYEKFKNINIPAEPDSFDPSKEDYVIHDLQNNYDLQTQQSQQPYKKNVLLVSDNFKKMQKSLGGVCRLLIKMHKEIKLNSQHLKVIEQALANKANYDYFKALVRHSPHTRKIKNKETGEVSEIANKNGGKTSVFAVLQALQKYGDFLLDHWANEERIREEAKAEARNEQAA